MAISDKVIELTPVKKGKTAIFIVLMSVFLAMAGTFLTLWILKTPATPSAVKSISITNKNLFSNADGKIEASANCSYSFSLDVGADANADKSVDFEIIPSNAMQKFEVTGDPEVPGSLTVKFTISHIVTPGTDVTIIARSKSFTNVFVPLVFTVKHQFAEEVDFSELKKEENGQDKVYDIGAGEVTLPVFIDSQRNDYKLGAIQRGPLGENGDYAQLTQGLTGLEGKKVETLFFETDNTDVLYINEYAGNFSVLKPGTATITVYANKFNNATQKPLKKLTVTVKDSSEFNRIYQIDYTGGGESINIFIDENTVVRSFNLREKLSVLPADYEKPFDYINVYESDKYGNASTEPNSPIRIVDGSSKNWKILPSSTDSVGSTYITVRDFNPDGLDAKLVLQVNVKAPIKKLTAMQGDGTPVSAASPINTFRGSKVDAILSYNLGTATVNENILQHMLPEMRISYISAPTPPTGSPSNLPNYAKPTNNHDYCIVLANSARQGSDIVVNNLDLTVDNKTVKGKLTFNIGKNVINGEYVIKLKLFPQSACAAEPESVEISPEITIKFVISQEAKSIQFKDNGALESVFEKDKLTELALISGSIDKSVLSVNVMNKASSDFSLYDLFFLLDSSDNGNIIGGSMSDNNRKKFTFITKSGVLTSDFKILSQTRGFTADITVRFKVDNNLTLEKTITLKFVDKVIGLVQNNPDADRKVYFGKNALNSFDTSLNSETNDVIREKLYSGNTGNILKSTERLVNITVEHNNKQYLLKKNKIGEYNYFYDYNYSGSLTDTSKAFFTEKNGKISINSDLYERSYSLRKNYSDFEIYFSLEDLKATGDNQLSDVMPEAYTSVTYNLIRKADEIRLYTSNDYDVELTKKMYELHAKEYFSVSANKDSSIDLYPSPVVKLVDGTQIIVNETGTQDLVEGYELKAVDALYSNIIGNPLLIDSNNAPDKINLVTKGTAGETKLGLYSFNLKSSIAISQTVLISVEDNSLPISGIVIKYNGNMVTDQTVIPLTTFLEGSTTCRMDFAYEVTYDIYNAKYSMLDSVSFLSKDGAVAFTNVVLPYERISEIPGGIPADTPYTFKGSFTIVAKDKNTESDDTVIIQSKSKVNDEFIKSTAFKVKVTTLIDSIALYDGTTEYKNTEPLVSSGTIRLQIGAANGLPTSAQNTLTIRYKSKNGSLVDLRNVSLTSLKYYDKQGNEVTGKLDIISTPTGYIISALNYTLDGYVILTVNENFSQLGVADKEYKVRIDIAATALTHKVVVNQGGLDRGPSSPINIETTGESAVSSELELTCKINTPDLQPQNKSVSHTFYKFEGGRYVVATGNNIFSIVNQNGLLKLIYKNVTNTGGVQYAFSLTNNGVESEIVPLNLTTQKLEMKFVEESQFSLSSGKLTFNKFTAETFDFKVKVFNVGTGSEVTGIAPSGITYTVTDAVGQPTSVASISGSLVSINAAQGTFVVRASYIYNGVTYYREVTVNLFNRVNSIAIAPLPNNYPEKPVGYAAQIWMAKGATLNLNSYVTLKADSGDVYSTAYTLNSSSSNVTVEGNVLTAVAANTASGYTDITITAPKRENDTTPAVTAKIRVIVREPRINITSPTALELLSSPSAVLSFTVTDTHGVALDYISDSIVITADESLAYTYSGGVHTVTAIPSKFTGGLTSANIYIRGKVSDGTANGIEFSKDVAYSVDALFKPIVEVENAENNSLDFNSGLVYTAKTTNTMVGFTPVTKYKIASGSSYADIDPDTGVLSYRSGSLGTIGVLAEWTLFGKTVASDVVNYATRNSSSLKTEVYHTSLTEANKVADGATIDIDFVNASKSVFVVLDYSLSNLDIKAGDESKFNVAVSAPGYSEVSKTLDITNKRFISEYKVTKTGTLQIMSSTLTINGVAYQSTLHSMSLRAVLPDVKVTATQAVINPGSSSAINVVVGNGKYTDGSTPAAGIAFQGLYTVDHEIVSGASLVTSSESNDNLLVNAKKQTAGGIVAVRTTVSISNGVFAGQTYQTLTYINIKKYEEPKIEITAAQPIAVGETIDLSTLIKVIFDNADTDAAFSARFSYPAGSNALGNSGSSFKPLAAAANTKVNVNVSITVTAGYFEGNVIEGIIGVPVKPGFAIDAKSFVTAGQSIPLAYNFLDGNNQALSGITADIIYTVKSGNGFIQALQNAGRTEYSLKSPSPSNGGTIVVGASAVIRGGTFDGATLTAEFSVKILTISFTGELTRAPGGEVDVSAINAKLLGDGADKNLNSSIIGDYNVEMHCIFGAGDYVKTTVSGNKLLIAKDANFTSSLLRTVFTLKLTSKTDANKVFYNETYLNISNAELPTLKVSYQVNTGTMNDGIDKLVKEDVVKFFFSIEGDGRYSDSEISGVTLTADQPGGTITPIDKKTVSFAVSSAYSGDLQFNFKALVFGHELTCNALAGRVGATNNSGFEWIFDYSEVSSGGQVEARLDAPTDVGFYNFSFTFPQNLKNNFSSVTLYSSKHSGTVYQTASSNKIDVTNWDYMKDIRLVFNAKNPVSNATYSLPTTAKYYRSGYGSASPTLNFKSVNAILNESSIILTASKNATGIDNVINVSTSATNYSDLRVTYSASANGNVTANGMVSAKNSNIVQKVTVTSSVMAGGNSHTPKTKSIDLFFVPSATLKINSSAVLSIPKGENGILSLSNGAESFASSVSYVSSNTSVLTVSGNGNAHSANALSKGSCDITATYIIGGVTFTSISTIAVTEAPTLTVNKSGRDYNLSVTAGNPVYSYVYMETGTMQHPLVTASVVGNQFTFNDNPDTLGGKVTVKFTATYSSGEYKGIVLSETVQFTVDTPTAPTLTLNLTANTVEPECNYSADFTYNVIAGGNAVIFDDQTQNVFRTVKQKTEVKAIVRVTATINVGAYINTVLQKDIDITVAAESMPVYTAEIIGDSASGGKIETKLDGTEIISTFTAVTGASAITIETDGTYVKTPQAATVNVIVRASYTIQSGAYSGTVCEKLLDIVVDAAAKPTYGAELVGDNAVGGKIVTKLDGAEVDSTFTVISGNSAVSVGIDGSYTKTQQASPVDAVVKASYTLTNGIFNGMTFDSYITVSVGAASKPTYSVELENDNTSGGRVVTKLGGTQVSSTFSVISNAAAITLQTDGTYTKNAQANNVNVVIKATHTVVGGIFDGVIFEEHINVNVDAAAKPIYTAEIIGDNASGGKIETKLDGAEVTSTFSVISNAAAITLQQDGTYTKNPQASAVKVIVKVNFTLTSGVYSGTPYEKLLEISVDAAAKPIYTAEIIGDNESGGRIETKLDGTEVISTFSVISNAAAITLQQDGTYTKIPQAVAVNVVIKASHKVVGGVFNDYTFDELITVSVNAATKPIYSVELAGDTASGGKIVTKLGGTEVISTFSVISNASAISLQQDGTYTKIPQAVAVNVVIKASHKAVGGVFNDYTFDELITVSVNAATKPAFTALADDLANGKITASANYGADFTFRVITGGSVISFTDSNLPNYILNPSATDTEAVVEVTAIINEGVYAGTVLKETLILNIAHAATFGAEFGADNTVNAICNYGADITYAATEGQSAISFLADQPNKFTLIPQAVATPVKILVTATVNEGRYTGKVFTQVLDLVVPAAPVLSLSHDEANKRISPSIDTADVVAYEVVAVTDQVGGLATPIGIDFFTFSTADGWFAYSTDSLTETVSFTVEIKYTVTEGAIKGFSYSVTLPVTITVTIP